jgi:hypothetical protein
VGRPIARMRRGASHGRQRERPRRQAAATAPPGRRSRCKGDTPCKTKTRPAPATSRLFPTIRATRQRPKRRRSRQRLNRRSPGNRRRRRPRSIRRARTSTRRHRPSRASSHRRRRSLQWASACAERSWRSPRSR